MQYPYSTQICIPESSVNVRSKIFQPIRDVLRFSYETGKTQLRIFAGCLSRNDTVPNSLPRAITITLLEMLQESITKLAARIGHELTETHDDSGDFPYDSYKKKRPIHARGYQFQN